MRWHWSNQNKSRPNIKSDAFKKILWKERERGWCTLSNWFLMGIYWFLFFEERWFNLDFECEGSKDFFFEKAKHASVCR